MYDENKYEELKGIIFTKMDESMLEDSVLVDQMIEECKSLDEAKMNKPMKMLATSMDKITDFRNLMFYDDDGKINKKASDKLNKDALRVLATLQNMYKYAVKMGVDKAKM